MTDDRHQRRDDVETEDIPHNFLCLPNLVSPQAPKRPTMASFNLEDFTRRLLTETLFYDEEYGALGNLSLIDTEAAQERYVASYLPEDGSFVIEEATEWETDVDSDEEDAIGYALAIDSEEHGAYDTAEEAADVLLALARNEGLLPSITLLFEEDEVV